MSGGGNGRVAGLAGSGVHLTVWRVELGANTKREGCSYCGGCAAASAGGAFVRWTSNVHRRAACELRFHVEVESWCGEQGRQRGRERQEQRRQLGSTLGAHSYCAPEQAPEVAAQQRPRAHAWVQDPGRHQFLSVQHAVLRCPGCGVWMGVWLAHAGCTCACGGWRSTWQQPRMLAPRPPPPDSAPAAGSAAAAGAGAVREERKHAAAAVPLRAAASPAGLRCTSHALAPAQACCSRS